MTGGGAGFQAWWSKGPAWWSVVLPVLWWMCPRFGYLQSSGCPDLGWCVRRIALFLGKGPVTGWSKPLSTPFCAWIYNRDCSWYNSIQWETKGHRFFHFRLVRSIGHACLPKKHPRSVFEMGRAAILVDGTNFPQYGRVRNSADRRCWNYAWKLKITNFFHAYTWAFLR